MMLQQTSSLIPNNVVHKRDLLHSRMRLHYLAKAAVDKACKLHVESRRLVHIVDTQSCGSSKGIGLSNSFSSLMKKSSPSSSRQWALSKGSDDRLSVAARIHALLIEWKADSSFEWRVKVASAVPVLEEALYKGAKSKEEYTNPQLLESQLIHVLCHFEAGNGPFLLQGSTPLYSVRARSPSSLARVCELASEQTCERARLSRLESSATGSSTNSVVVPSNIQETANLGHVDCKEVNHQNHGGHASNGFLKKVADMLAKKRRESSVCLMHDLGRANSGLERAEDGQGRINANNGMGDALRPADHVNSCTRHERRTLGGILQLNMVNESTTQEAIAIESEEASIARSGSDQGAGSAEAPPSPSNICTETSRDMTNMFPVDFTRTLDSGTSEEEISSFLVSDDEGSNVSVTTRAVLECGATNEPFAHCGRRSFHLPFSSSSSSSSFTPIAFSSSTSASSLTPPLSTSTSPSSSLHLFSLSRSRLLPALPSSSSALSASSSSPLQQQQAQHRSQCQPERLVPLSTASDVASVHLHCSQPQIAGEPNDCNSQSAQPQAFRPAEGPGTQVELQQSATQTVAVQHAEAGRGTFSLNSSPLASNEVSSRARERGLKLPLRRFLAEREEYKGCVSGYVDGRCPWETWEEATEQIDGMCCVCMVGLKGAAFIPCGHTFCRKCSRELWRGRGTCPLCNRI